MKEIKFRAWHQYDKRMVYGPSDDVVSPSWVLAMCSANNMEPMQYTGLKDKNGKEVYEGDIFKRENHWPIYKVVFEEGCFMLENHGMLYPIHSREIRDEMSEIIGNIYEKADLLK